MSRLRLSKPELALSRLLRASRHGAGLSQEEMAKALALRQSDISKLERGERKLGVLEFRLWGNAVGMPFDTWAKALDDELVAPDSLHRRLVTRTR